MENETRPIPGLNDEFHLLLDKDWFQPGDILNDQVVIISKPKKIRTNLFWRVIRFVTFGKYGQIEVCYKVKLKDDYRWRLIE